MPQSGLSRGVSVLLAGFIFCFTCPDGILHAQEPPAFEVSLTELPGSDTETLNPTKMASDGTVVANAVVVVGGDNVVHTMRLLPGADEFEDLGGGPAFQTINLMPLVTDDASTILVNRIEIDDDEAQLGVPSTWTEVDGWQPLPGLVLETSIAQAITGDGSHVVGRGRDDFSDLDDFPWVWSADDGQEPLDMDPDMVGGEAHAVGTDGSIIGGKQYDLEGGGFFPQRDFGTRWVDGQPQVLFDDTGQELGPVLTCSADCSVLAGSQQGGDVDFEHPNWGQAWYWSEDDGAVYLGTLPEAEPGLPYYSTDISADGSTIVGVYSVFDDQDVPVYRPFIWTQQTGLLSLATLLDQEGLLDDDWSDMLPSAITPDGGMVLLTGTDLDFNSKAAIMHLGSAGGEVPIQSEPIPALGPAAMVLLALMVLLVAWRRVG